MAICPSKSSAPKCEEGHDVPWKNELEERLSGSPGDCIRM